MYPVPMIPGASAIGRVAAAGPDSTLLKAGDLVLVDVTIHSRDDPNATMLSGIIQGHTEGGKKLMSGEWRDSTYAEYAKMPLEVCTILDEKRLCGSGSNRGDEESLGYSINNLSYISATMVPYGGLHDVGVQAGETVIVAPATGQFGQAAVLVALAMGAKVIAMGRNKTMLSRLTQLSHPGRVITVPITGDVEADTATLKRHGPIDVYFDISPPMAAGSTHLKSCIMALRPGSRVSLMGGIRGDVGIPYTWVMRNGISLKGKWMFERSDVVRLVGMVEKGILDLKRTGRKVEGYGLEEWEKAFERAGEGENVVLVP